MGISILYIYLSDANIKFEYQPNNMHFIYNDRLGKTHRYYPDFYIIDDNKYIEIKGDNHFSKDGKPIFNGKYDWTDRYKCMIDNNVQILTGKDIRPILKLYGGYKAFKKYKCNVNNKYEDLKANNRKSK